MNVNWLGLLQTAQLLFQKTVETMYYPVRFSKFASATRQRIIQMCSADI